jgi:glutamate synthase (NADPH/NADH) small chain
MGSPRAFIETPRRVPGYRPREERIKDFLAVERQMSHEELKLQSSRCMDCGTPFCHSYGCPLGNIIPEFNEMVYRGRWRKALDILISTNNFPEFTGRVCPAPCEAACVAGLASDPVTIRHIELAVIEKGFEDGLLQSARRAAPLKARVAVIGSGPSGLAAADTLNSMGYEVVVYESAPRAGGILRFGIPDFKLEKWVLDRRIELMAEQGVSFETGVRVGDDISLNYLRKRFDALCLALGAREPRDLKVPGRDLEGIHFAMDYLTDQNLINAGIGHQGKGPITAAGKRVVVIGGGDTGSDCLGTALRQGAKQVVQLEILPLPPSSRASYTPWPMWPVVLRKSHAHGEGGEVRWGVMTKEFLGEGGLVRAVRCVEVEWKRDAEGKPVAPFERPGTEFVVEADLVLLAMGFTGCGNNELLAEARIGPDKRGLVETDEYGRTCEEGIFAAGDMETGQSLVVKAIAQGRRAAMGIDSYLRGLGCDRNS